MSIPEKPQPHEYFANAFNAVELECARKRDIRYETYIDILNNLFGPDGKPSGRLTKELQISKTDISINFPRDEKQKHEDRAALLRLSIYFNTNMTGFKIKFCHITNNAYCCKIVRRSSFYDDVESDAKKAAELDESFAGNWC